MLELLIILGLLILNGVFAMSEIALVSAKKARLQQRAEKGDAGAKMALALSKEPERLLSTVQVGITLIGVLAGAFGGASLAGYLAEPMKQVAWLAPYADQIAFGLIVVFITYLSLIIGELVPKNLALRHPEAIACAMAGPLNQIARWARPLVFVLEASTRALLLLFGKSQPQNGPTREEVEVLIREGMVTGELYRAEREMVEGVFDLRDLHAEEIMRPKPKVLFLSVDETLQDTAAEICESRQAVFPVYEISRDQVVGTVSLRDLLASSARGEKKPFRDLMREPFFVADNQPALTLLESLRKAPHFAALVTDEFGILRGLVTLEDLVEEVIGDLPEPAGQSAASQLRQTAPDSWLVDGLMEIDAVCESVPGLEDLVEMQDDNFQTLAGYIVNRLERLPQEGESFTAGAFSFEIVDMDRQRIDKVAITRLPDAPREEAAEAEKEA